jgi:uncharacterized RmlC-like cupin family protein
MPERPSVVRDEEMLPATLDTPGLHRRTAFEDETAWAGVAHADAHTFSGWHVHPGHDTFALVLGGILRIEFGPGGDESVEAGPRGMVKIPKGVVHREGNPGDDPSETVVFRTGTGPLVVNVDGPDDGPST